MCPETRWRRPAKRATRGIAALLLMLPWPALAQPVRPEEPIEERALVRLRSARVRIEPRQGYAAAACHDLGLDELEVKLDGRRIGRENLLELERERRSNIHALLIDTSSSMSGHLGRVRDLAADYVRWLRPEHERGLVASFDESVILAQGVTADRQQMLEAVEKLRISAMTSLYDGLYLVIQELDAYRERPVIVLLTDGVDTSSMSEQRDVWELVEVRPDLTVFTIGIALPDIGPGGATPKRFLQRLGARSNGKFFNVPTQGRLGVAFREIRAMLENEALLTFVDPDPSGETARGRIRVRSRRPACRITTFRWREPSAVPPSRRPIAPSGLPATLELSPAPLLARMADRLIGGLVVDPACAPEGHGDPDSLTLADLVRLNVRPRRLDGCHLDITMAYGPLYSIYADKGFIEPNGWTGMKVRPLGFAVAPPEGLPRSPVGLMDELGARALALAAESPEIDSRMQPAEQHARPFHDFGSLAHGQTFLDTRWQVARALFEEPSYRNWTNARLRAEADAELVRLKRRFRRYAPDASEALLDRIVLESEQGRAILAMAEHPTGADVRRHLGAWLGDIAAHELFVAWEKRHADRLLALGDPGDGALFTERWQALRRLFFVPSYARTLALVAPVYSEADDRIGFWRIVLPRPGWLMPRVQGRKKRDHGDIPLDLLPDRPLAYWLLERLARREPERIERLRRLGYRIGELRYELLTKPREQRPQLAYRKSRVILDLVATGGAPIRWIADLGLERNGRLVLEGDTVSEFWLEMTWPGP